MTFKHINFEDSTTMRSLMKVAQDKGWIKEEALQKTASASKKPDLSPTENLTENLLKLCAGLRASGFDKHADELESRFVQYKKANAEYGVGDEEGEDLIHAAHPKGSHKMENIDSSEATFEDILDKHVQMMKAVEKKPTGKLSDASQILGAVSKVIGADFLAQTKVAQEAPPANAGGPSAGGIAADVGATVGFTGGIAGLKWLIGKLSSDPSVDQKALQFAQEALGRKLTNAEANAITKQVVEKIGAQSIEKALGQGAASQIEKAVAEKAITQAVAQGARSEATNPGFWSSAVNFFKGSGGAAAEGTEVAGVGVAGSVAAIVGAAIAGGLIGNALFEHFLAPDELKDAGGQLLRTASALNEGGTFTEDLGTGFRTAYNKFNTAFSAVMNNYGVIENIKETKNIEDMPAFVSLYNALLESNKQASAMWGWGQSYKDDHWFATTVNFFGDAAGNLVAQAKNYMERSMAIADLMFKFISQAAAKVHQAQAEAALAKGGAGSEGLFNKYQATLSTISSYKAQMDARRPKNQSAIDAWLNQAAKEVKAEQDSFTKIDPANREVSVQPYQVRLADINSKLDMFKNRIIGAPNAKS